jgi:hypothetical protein
MVVYTYNPLSTQKAETGGLQDPGQFGLHSETLSQQQPTTTTTKKGKIPKKPSRIMVPILCDLGQVA